jgi:pSer/pThr/pTyr-binding forkhead associated (FHA) protein
VSQVVIEDGSVSKRHVWVGVRDGAVMAIDEGSTNGTYVNAVTTRINRQPLNIGDTLIISNDIARLVYQR